MESKGLPLHLPPPCRPRAPRRSRHSKGSRSRAAQPCPIARRRLPRSRLPSLAARRGPRCRRLNHRRLAVPRKAAASSAAGKFRAGRTAPRERPPRLPAAPVRSAYRLVRPAKPDPSSVKVALRQGPAQMPPALPPRGTRARRARPRQAFQERWLAGELNLPVRTLGQRETTREDLHLVLNSLRLVRGRPC
jgi:hypothetical protein